MILFWSNESNFFHYQGLGKGRINISKLKDGKFWLIARLIPKKIKIINVVVDHSH